MNTKRVHRMKVDMSRGELGSCEEEGGRREEGEKEEGRREW